MRKITAICLTAVLFCLLMTACGEEAEPREKAKNRLTPTGAEQVSATPEPTGEPAPSATPEPTGEPAPSATPTEPAVPTTTATPTEAPTATPTVSAEPTLVPVKPEVREFSCDSPNKALLAYTEKLNAIIDEAQKADSKIEFRFGLCFVNSDITPELWIEYPSDHVELYAYDGTQSVLLISFSEESGRCGYFEQGNLVSRAYPYEGGYRTDYYVMVELTMSPFLTMEEKPAGDGNTRYYHEGREILKEEYDYIRMQIVTPSSIDATGSHDSWFVEATGYEYSNSEVYPDLFEEYRTVCGQRGWEPFPNGIPEEILKLVTGVWQLTGGTVEGWEWSAEEEGDEATWTFDENGNGTYLETAPYEEEPEQYHFTYMPRGKFYEVPWCLEVLVDAEREFYFYIWVDNNGRLVQNHFCAPEKFSSLRFFEQ